MSERYRPKLIIEPYDDDFWIPCMWPVRMKRGDGSTDHCGDPARHRIIFESGGRTMLCPKHLEAIEGDGSPKRLPEAAPLLKLLKRLETSGEIGSCPDCGANPYPGCTKWHSDTCDLHAMITALEVGNASPLEAKPEAERSLSNPQPIQNPEPPAVAG